MHNTEEETATHERTVKRLSFKCHRQGIYPQTQKFQQSYTTTK